jgi:oxygen-independent coproporphyrinogen III oxidase
MNGSLYFHIPFCRRRCGYCDFTTYAGFERLIPAYMRALEKQVSLFADDVPVHTIFFGGGTPSLVAPEAYSELFAVIRRNFPVTPDAEISLEANPGTVTRESLNAYRAAGFNRISFGMQSAREDELRLLDRQHTMASLIDAITYARQAGFDNLNLDLIFGLPGQSVDDWKESLDCALGFKPEHLSLYSLIVEDGTPLESRITRGIVPAPDDDTAAEQYDWTCEFLESAGFEHYEISNWALKQEGRDLRCRHNLQYWRLLPYYGFGAGAVGFLPAGSSRLAGTAPVIMQNENWIGRYIRQVDEAAAGNFKSVFLQTMNRDYEMNTFMFTGFRLLEEGIDPAKFLRRFNKDIRDVFGNRLAALEKDGLIETLPIERIRLTRGAWLVANRVFREFAGDD